ncbi:AraC-like ligand-binding domain-containing protein [Gordonia terrae]
MTIARDPELADSDAIPSPAPGSSAVAPGLMQDAISSSFFECDVEIPRPREFQASVRIQHFATLQFVEVASDRHVACRGRERIERDRDGRYLAVLQLAGGFRVEQDGRIASLGPGDMCFIDSRSPVSVEASDDYRAVGVVFPGHVLSYPPASLAGLTARAVQGNSGFAAPVSSMLLTLNRTMATIDTSHHYKMMRGVVEVVESIFAAMDTGGGDALTVHESRIDKIKEYLEAHLSDRDLNPGSVAAAHYISARHLHYLFRETGVSMSTWVRTRRLERCLADLVDDRLAHVHIATIARNWGFHSTSHFGQVVKSATGLSPKQFRESYGPSLTTRTPVGGRLAAPQGAPYDAPRA